MRLPRDVSGEELPIWLRRCGYEETRQTGSHMRLTTMREGEHHVTIPRHGSLRVGTLNAILHTVSGHLGIPKHTLTEMLFGE